MNVEELQEQSERAHDEGQKGIGLTTAIVAVLLAVAMLLSHRSHTEEIKMQTKVNDGWEFYQAKHQRAYNFGLEADKALLSNQNELASRYLKASTDEECGVPAAKDCASPMAKVSPPLQQFVKENSSSGDSAQSHDASAADNEVKSKQGAAAASRKDGAVDLQEKTRDLEKETDLTTRRADLYDAAELFLEISIVLCSIALLAEMKIYWRLSFVTTAVGIGVAAWAWFLHS